jgi:uncharacterized RDD family membrane protein YckC
MIDERFYSVETPEQIDLAYDVAGVGSRVLAALVDHLLVALIVLLGVIALIALNDVLGGASFLFLVTLLGFGTYFLLCAYHILFEVFWNGQTPGKRMMGLRMIQVSGRPIGFGASTIRNLVRVVDFLPGVYAVGFLTMFFDKRARRLGDIAAGCMAVRQRDVVTLDSLATPNASQRPVVAAAQQVTIPNLDALRGTDINLVHDFLRRAMQMEPTARRRLAQQLVAVLQQRLGYPIGGNPEDFLVQVASEYRTLEESRAR